jgi:selenocysteine lyase/cysteine desulfurase
MDAHGLRARFGSLERIAYLNAGTNGPVATSAVQAAERELRAQCQEGRTVAHYERRVELQDALRARYAALLGCESSEVALTTSTSEGLGKVLAGLALGAGDEILTSDQEHPGLVGPLIAARARGAAIRTAPLARLAEHVSKATTLVACSHVGWVSGELADPALAEVGVPVILDGAQGAGAVPVDVRALGCDAYAAAGQKWLCGADGTGILFIGGALFERVTAVAPSYISFADTGRGLESPLREDARRHDTPSLSREGVAFNLAALDALASDGWDPVLTPPRRLAAALAERLAEAGCVVAPRAATTLVSWEDADPESARDRLAAAGVVVRSLPRTPYLRASVGAWNDESDLDRLLDAL